MYKNNVFYFLVIVIIGWNTSVYSQQDNIAWKEESHVYTKVLDAPLKGYGLGDSTSLLQLAHQNPTILALIFTRCTGICNPFLLQLSEKLEWEIEHKNFNIVVISFDPRDTQADMSALAKRFHLDQEKQWIFGVTDSIESLNKSIDFNPIWDEARQQYDHEALLVGINSDGYITKKLIGMRSTSDLALLVGSIYNSFTPTHQLPNKNRLFSCFNYDPKTGKNTLGLGLLFIALPAILTIFILFTSNYLGKSERIG
ncbi:MAG: SCO family protein [Saprospiraceae bacterium]|nr:SCO family protein [Saprospiraceae bacterium]